jgi:hypothetical protein
MVDIGFARYTDDGVAVLNFTNSTAGEAGVATELIAMSAFENPGATLPTWFTLADNVQGLIHVVSLRLLNRRLKCRVALPCRPETHMGPEFSDACGFYLDDFGSKRNPNPSKSEISPSVWKKSVPIGSRNFQKLPPAFRWEAKADYR